MSATPAIANPGGTSRAGVATTRSIALDVQRSTALKALYLALHHQEFQADLRLEAQILVAGILSHIRAHASDPDINNPDSKFWRSAGRLFMGRCLVGGEDSNRMDPPIGNMNHVDVGRAAAAIALSSDVELTIKSMGPHACHPRWFAKPGISLNASVKKLFTELSDEGGGA